MLLSPFWIPQARTLSIDPSRISSIFGFALLEGPERLIDWGITRVWSGSDDEFLSLVESLIDRYQPELLVVESVADTRRGKRAIKRLTKLTRYVRSRGIEVVTVSRREVRLWFASSGTTKHEIAVAVSRQFPELEPRLPPRRKPWMTEDVRMDIFDAVAFALVALGGEHRHCRLAS